MKKLLIILTFLLSLSAIKAAEPFWDYIGGPEGAFLYKISYNKQENIIYTSTIDFSYSDWVYKSTNNGQTWEYYFNDFVSTWVSTNSNGMIVGIDTNLYFKPVNQSKKRINVPRFRYTFHKYLSINDYGKISFYQEPDGSDTSKLFVVDTKDSSIFTYSFFENDVNKTVYTYDVNNFCSSGKYFLLSLNVRYNDNLLDSTLIIKLDEKLIPTDTFSLNDILYFYPFITKDNRLVAGNWNKTFISEKNSTRWETISNQGGYIYESENYLYLIYDSIFVSKDYGKTWNSLFKSDLAPINAIAVNDSLLYGVGVMGFSQIDISKRTTTYLNKGMTSVIINDIAFDKKGKIYLSTAYAGVFISRDDGINWEYIGLRKDDLRKILVGTNGYIYTTSIRGGIYRSTDEGVTWQFLKMREGSSQPDVTSLFENRRGHIFAGAAALAGYYFSTNFGETWKLTSIKDDNTTNCFSMNSEGHIFRGAYAGMVYRSTDDGDTWEKMTNYFSGSRCWWNIISITFDPKGTKGFALCLRTTDNGRKWFQDPNPSSDYSQIFDSLGNYIKVDYDYSNEIWQVYRSSDKGNNWENISTGINHYQLKLFVISPDGYYFIVPESGGLYRSRDKFVSVEEKPKPSEDIAITPNPASDYIEISVINPMLKHGVEYSDIKILNVYGQTVLSVGVQILEPLRIDVSALPPGMYFVRIDDKVSKFVKL